MLMAILIILAASATLSALTMFVLFRIGRVPAAEDMPEDCDAQQYDAEGNHIHYDRQLIALQKKERASGNDKQATESSNIRT